jgi:hypothetical protein
MPKDDRAFMLKQMVEADASVAPVPQNTFKGLDEYMDFHSAALEEAAYSLPNGDIIELSTNAQERFAQVKVLDELMEKMKIDAFSQPVPQKEPIPNFYYQPPWGDAILISGTREERDRKVDHLNKWYKEYPTLEEYNEYCLSGNLTAVPVEKAATGITFGTGARRDALAPRYDLIPPCALKRLAQIYTEGAEHYGAHNWQKGMDWSDTINHALAHLFNYLNGDYNEDHLAKVAWGMFALMYFEDADVGNNDLYKWHWEKKE